jgi:hypothetical protein
MVKSNARATTLIVSVPLDAIPTGRRGGKDAATARGCGAGLAEGMTAAIPPIRQVLLTTVVPMPLWLITNELLFLRGIAGDGIRG